MASPILTHHKYICQLSSFPIRKPTVATLSNSVSFSSTRVHHLGLIPLSQWNGLRQFSVSISHNYVKFEKRRKCRGKGVYASLFGVGAPEALVIGVVALLVFGPKGLAEVARNLGKTLREFQPTIRELQDVSREFKSTLEREIGLDEVQNPTQKNYSSTATNTNSSPSAIKSPENSQIKADGSLPVDTSSSGEVYLKTTDDQLESVSTQQEIQTESVEEIQSEPETIIQSEPETIIQSEPETPIQSEPGIPPIQSELETPSQVEEPAAVVPPTPETKSDA